MNIHIDISNYEEFLLSAVDGELSGEEMAALELFLQQHPHIREELTLLESVKLMPDEAIQFDSKAQLYRQEGVPSLAVYEEQLLDYVDNELHGAEKQSLEELIRVHPQFAQEVNLLQRTRLQPDLNLQYGDRSSLYRHNRTKVRPIWWWSAAAAVVAGVAVLLMPGVNNEKQSQVAVNQPVVKTVVPTAPEPVVNEEHSTVNTIAQNTPQQEERVNKPVNSRQQPTNMVADKQPVSSETGVNNPGNGLAKLAQPVNTSEEVVQRLQDKINEQQEEVAAAITNPVVKAPVLANAAPAVKAEDVVSAPVQGELVVSVTMNGDSKLLNGVANVARFFSKKKK